MKQNKSESKKSLVKSTHTKKGIFYSITVLIPFFMFVFLEIGLRIFNYGGNTDLFVSTPDVTSKYFGINLEIAKRYFTTLSDVPTPRKDLFLKVKPQNGYRIFVLGESTAAGFPYGNNVTFTRILNRRLSDTFPDKHIEVVNTAMTAINSYSQLDFMNEILQHKPDAILIYSGHNEFYGALGVGSMESFGKQRWIVKATLFLQKFRTYILIRNFILDIKNWFGSDFSLIETSDPNSTLMQRIVKNKIIPFNSKDYEIGKNQFRENLSEIIQGALDKGVKVLIGELVSNVHDSEPFETVEIDKLPRADEVFKTAKEYENQGKYDEARKTFYLAKDLDALRFRAPEDFNIIIHKLAAKYKIPVVPIKSYFESNSPNQIIGNNLMHEHLHPNIEGYFIMADAFFNSMRKEKFISTEWPEANIKSSSYYRKNWGFTPLDSMYAYLSVVQLKGGWPFKKNQSRNLALINFQPSNKVDSVAARILMTKGMTLEMGHMELAKYYESRGELELAFKESNALVYTVPFLDLFYEPAVKYLVQMGKYDKALEVLQESLKYQETQFAYQWIGQIYLINGETPKGISYLEKAKEIGSNDASLIYNLGRAYYKISRFNQGDAILIQLKNISADPFFISNLEELRKSSYENFQVASQYLKEAENNLKDKNYSKANILLEQSLQVQETPEANETIGVIKLINGNKTEALRYLEKAYAISYEANPKLLYNLSNAYYINKEFEKAKMTYKQLKKSYPSFSDSGNLESKLYKVDKTLIN